MLTGRSPTTTFGERFKKFQVSQPGEDLLRIRHHFYLPDLKNEKLGTRIYHTPPWTVYRKNDSCIYLEGLAAPGNPAPEKISVVNRDTAAPTYTIMTISVFKGEISIP